ncbi:hypothetical protein K438DRAFT_1784873 [Mycena galopus ATCC 62051]|nr:hypothetical protein K438DRAFT_1784873 [Mycena galopus ATCC 62051]
MPKKRILGPSLLPPLRPPVAMRPVNTGGGQIPEISCKKSASFLPRNKEELREKARIRMAARRRAIKDSGEVSQEHADHVKQAHTTKGEYLAFKQRLHRQQAFIAKHGNEAYRARTTRETARADARWAEQMEEANRTSCASRPVPNLYP